MPPNSTIFKGRRYWHGSIVFNDKVAAEATADHLRAGGKAYARVIKTREGYVVGWSPKR